VPSAITAWYGGIGPAILASLLSTLALDYFFVPPLYSWSLPADRIPYIAVFPLFGFGMAVRDSGVGLASETLDQLFKPFYTTKAEGMGMGLAISRSIVAAHGGRLWATPNERRGATFHFVVPAEGHPAPSSER
jgi:K+-sensing histidine kinase KdpD